MIGPNATALELVIEAQTDPISVLRICQSRLIEARDLVAIEFDEFHAAQEVREIGAILGAVADAMHEHSLSRPFVQKRPRAFKLVEEEAVPF